MPWHIVVENRDGRREPVGPSSADLAPVVRCAIALADELGGMAANNPQDRRVDVVADDGEVEISIAIIPGGLDPTEA
ncbi:hypothetical protein [Sphingomonas abietis]|uniref:Uncharacterized protein n=1 Tax=Sphingomonas abietis TaxID=3012344 RepID=A0ABY7NSB3_9SPHN|nr:hypothetical protein [Sphingomonas abietis]WBO24432.1 hypothetical protein PBT88_10180 [Sphingomonas abietis]